MLCLVGDNCGVNQSMFCMLKVPLNGCGAHKFNLAVCKWISNPPQLEGTIQHVANAMEKASTLKVIAQLCKLTKLNPAQQNDTPWSSIYEMIERFLLIQAELGAVSDLLPLWPTHVECDILQKGFSHLEQFHQVTISMLQMEGITLVEVRDLFDKGKEDYPELGRHLSVDSKICVDQVFDRAV